MLCSVTLGGIKVPTRNALPSCPFAETYRPCVMSIQGTPCFSSVSTFRKTISLIRVRPQAPTPPLTSVTYFSLIIGQE